MLTVGTGCDILNYICTLYSSEIIVFLIHVINFRDELMQY